MASINQINEVDDPRLEEYRELRDADLRGARKLFTVESERVLSRFLQSEWKAHSILIEESVADRLHPLLSLVEESTPIYVTKQGLLRSITGYGFHGGALALGLRSSVRHELDQIETILERDKVTLLAAEGVVHVDNIGALFRNGACIGTDGILLSPTCSDPLLRKAIRISTGRVFEVPWMTCANWRETLVQLRDHYQFTIIALENSSSAVDIELMECGPRNLILVGSEGHGIEPETLAICDQTVQIPAGSAPTVESMNVAVASAIGLHELGRRRRRAENLDLGS